MKRFQNVLLVSDLDGTLLQNDKTISPETTEALRYFTEQGGRFTVATGRAISSTVRFFDRLPITAPYICMNGAVINREDGSLLRHSGLPAEADQLLDVVLSEFPEAGCEVFIKDQVYVLQMSEHTRIHFERVHIEPVYKTRAELPPIGEWSKINLTGDPALIAKITERLSCFADSFSMASSLPHFCEITSKDGVKGNAVAFLADHCGIHHEHVYVAGDSPNDQSMMDRFCSFAPANADPSIQGLANVIVSDNEHSALVDAVRWLDQKYGK